MEGAGRLEVPAAAGARSFRAAEPVQERRGQARAPGVPARSPQHATPRAPVAADVEVAAHGASRDGRPSGRRGGSLLPACQARVLRVAGTLRGPLCKEKKQC